jgi:DHA1 family multidrug resistance protein-like MFS transporter
MLSKVLISLTRINNVQFLSNMANVLSLLFIPVFARSFGASYLEVGFIVGIYSATTLISSFFFGRLADLRSLRTVLVFGFGFAALAFFLQVFALTPLSLLLARALAGFSVGILPGALVAYVHYQKHSLGKFISLGSLGWMLGYFVAGIIGENMILLFLLSALLYAFCFLQVLHLQDIEKPHLEASYFSLNTFIRNAGIYIPFFLRHTGAVGVWTIFPLYLRQLGASDFWIGLIYALNPAAQFLIMRRLDSIETGKMILAGYIFSVFGFISYIFAPSYLYAIPGMLLIACSWSFLYVGSTRYVVESNPDKATAAGLLNSMVGASGVAGALLGGFLSENFDFEAAMLGAALFSIFGLMLFEFFGKATSKKRSLKLQNS